MVAEGHDNKQLLLGIDLGTAHTALVSSRGYQSSIPSLVGYPKDIIAIKLLGKTQVFGAEALAHKSALTIYHPLQDGLIPEDGKRDYQAAAELLRHVVGLALTDPEERAGAVIGIPAHAPPAARETLQRIAEQLLDPVLVVSQPYLAGYYLDQLDNCLIIDVGAATTDICILRGAMPTSRDHSALLKAGDYLDRQLQSLISQRYPEVTISREMARLLKERYAFIGPDGEPIFTTLRAHGKPREYEISEQLRLACAGIVPEIMERVTALIRELDPEEQEQSLQNIYLTGGGSQIEGLAAALTEALEEYGPVRINSIAEPQYAGARGALRLARDLAPGQWQQFANARR